MKYIGIDIGLSGAIARIENNNVLEIIAMPTLQITKTRREYDIQTIVNFFKEHTTDIAILEKTQALPMLGTVQSHQLGRGSGIMIGILAALNIRYHVIHPKTWQKDILRDLPGKDTKTKSILAAQRIFPDTNFKRTERSKKIDHNFCDATLLAEYGRRHNL